MLFDVDQVVTEFSKARLTRLTCQVAFERWTHMKWNLIAVNPVSRTFNVQG